MPDDDARLAWSEETLDALPVEWRDGLIALGIYRRLLPVLDAVPVTAEEHDDLLGLLQDAVDDHEIVEWEDVPAAVRRYVEAREL